MKMKKMFKILFKTIAITICTLIVLMVAAAVLLNTDKVQNRLMQYAVSTLKKDLGTEVSIEHVYVDVLKQHVNLHKMTVDDLKGRKMLQMDNLAVGFDLRALLHNEVVVTKAKIDGLDAFLYQQAPDSTANYQFLIDAIKSKKAEPDSLTKTKKHPLNFRLGSATIDIDTLSYITDNGQPRQDLNKPYSRFFEVGHLNLQAGMLIKLKDISDGQFNAELSRCHIKNHGAGKKEAKIHLAAKVAYKDQKASIDIDTLGYVTKNGLPRRNTGKPHHGAFDTGHLDLLLKAHVDVDNIGKEGFDATVTNCQGVDNGSGLRLTHLQAKGKMTKDHLKLRNIVIRLPKTHLTMSRADITLPKKSTGRKLSYHTPMLKGTTQLKDISQPFAPTLKDFTVPLQLQCSVSGDDDGMRFGDVRVGTTDKKLHVKATGSIDHLKDKYLLHIHFDVNKMTALKGTPERIINQFKVKKYMMKQLNTLGRIEYTGKFDVYRKRETFAGILNTEMGAMNVELEIDGQNSYLNGSVGSDNFQLGKAMDNKHLGDIACKARFSFDISKVRTAQMRKEKGGKLPIGNVEAEVLEGHYSPITVHNVSATIESDGAVASGMVINRGKFIDLSCSFSFTDTNDMEKIHIKPGIRLHGKNKDAESYAIRKEKKEQEKIEKKERKEQEKKEKKERKEQEKKEKKERKEQAKKEKKEKKEREEG